MTKKKISIFDLVRFIFAPTSKKAASADEWTDNIVKEMNALGDAMRAQTMILQGKPIGEEKKEEEK